MNKNFACLEKLLRPALLFCLKRSLALADLIEAAKKVYVELAAEQLEKEGAKINHSRLSIITGIHRTEIKRLYAQKETKELSSAIVARLISRWRQDSRFLTKSGRPRSLNFEGERSEFEKLVRSVSMELGTGLARFQLVRTGAAKEVNNGTALKLVASGFVPRGNSAAEFEIMGEDIEDLAWAVIENLEHENEEDRVNFHAKTAFDNIDQDDLPEIQAWFVKQCASMHAKAERYLSKFDLDRSPSKKKRGKKRFVFGSFTRS